MRVVFRMSAIVAALLLGAAALGGCGQRGPLYMPTVPPLPTPPSDHTETTPSNVKPDAGAAASDASAAPLSLAPASALGTPPGAGKAQAASSPASSSPQDQ